MRTILILFSVVLLATIVVAGCGDGETSSGSDFELVATTPVVADLAAGVAGDAASVTALLPGNADPHDFEPSPSDAEALLDAGLIVRSGGDLDLWLDDLLDGAGADAPVLDLIDSVETIEGGHDHAHEDEHAEQEGDSEEEEGHADEEGEHGHEGEDPHWWQNPLNSIEAVAAIRDALVEADPGNAADFERNASGYIERLEDLDAAIETCVEQLPRDDRELVTSHDALGYYADRYGFEVVGAAIPALTTQAQASAGEIAELVDLIREHGVEAVFPEAGTSAGLERAIASEAGAKIGPELWADTLGPEGSGGETYVGAMAANTLNIVDALSGGEADCADLEAIAG